MKPLDWAHVMTRVDILKRKLDDALLERRYSKAAELVVQINAYYADLMLWLGSVKDGDHVSK